MIGPPSAIEPHLSLPGVLAVLYSHPYRENHEHLGDRPWSDVVRYSAQWEDFVKADPQNRLWGPLLAGGRSERYLFPGVMALALAAASLASRPISCSRISRWYRSLVMRMASIRRATTTAIHSRVARSSDSSRRPPAQLADDEHERRLIRASKRVVYANEWSLRTNEWECCPRPVT